MGGIEKFWKFKVPARVSADSHSDYSADPRVVQSLNGYKSKSKKGASLSKEFALLN